MANLMRNILYKTVILKGISERLGTRNDVGLSSSLFFKNFNVCHPEVFNTYINIQ